MYPTTTSSFRRLSGREIGLLRFIAKMAGHAFAVRLTRDQRSTAVAMWRGGIVNAWYRQVPACDRALQGPYFTLSPRGVRLAHAFTRPRDSAAQIRRG